MGRKRKDEGILVKVARTGTKVEEVALNGRHTVQDALEAAGVNKKSTEEITVNGEDAEMDYELEDGDRVLLTKNVEGGR
jgi:putative ubiquitin-RnfH superfamily antitoxin RatB of RatAB toxin-antitoxin module